MTKKGKFGVVHGSIQEQFRPYHLFIETGTKDDFQSEKIKQQVKSIADSRNQLHCLLEMVSLPVSSKFVPLLSKIGLFLLAYSSTLNH